MSNKENLKKLAETKGFQLDDDSLDSVAGGMYSNWGELSRETRLRLQQESDTAVVAGEYCEIYNADQFVEYTGG